MEILAGSAECENKSKDYKIEADIAQNVADRNICVQAQAIKIKFKNI